MIHGYHLILPMYGFWLPNDPRGSWSDYVRQWEIARFGRPFKTIDRRSIDELTEEQIRQRDAAKAALLFPPVSISGQQALTIAHGFARQIQTSNYTVWACAILPEHTHMVVARHIYKVERIANLLKGASTSEMIKAGNHPLQQYVDRHGRPQRMWSAHQWKVYLDNEAAIDEATKRLPMSKRIRKRKENRARIGDS